MASMNWLGFSLSPQELPASNPHHHHDQDHSQSTVVSRLGGFNSDEISGTDVSGECFDLTSDHSTAPSLNQLPPPFGILEAFNRNNHHSQDWNMKGLGMSSDTNYKTSSSDFSMLMGNTQNLENQQQQQPKLENFLGRHSFADHHHNHAAANYMFPTTCGSTLHVPSEEADAGSNNINGNGNSIGLSMIKTWLRNQPAPTQTENKNDVGATTGGGNNNSSATNGLSIMTSTNTNAQSSTLSLSMSTGSQSSSPLPLLAAASGGESSSSDNNKQQQQQPRTTAAGIDSQTGAIEAVPRKSIDTFGQRTSIYRGVTRHRWTGRYEAHLWDNSCRREGQTRKGRQVYLGGYDKEDKAARAYDLAALKYWGTTTTTNFPISNYEKELEEMKHMTRQEYVASLRRKSSGFSRGASIYRGVTRHHQHGRWQARIGRVAGNKDLYLGTFSTQEEAAEAYDIAAIKFRGLNAVTNFDMSRYDVKSILESSTLPIGGAAKRLKEVEQAEMTVDGQRITDDDNMSSQLTDAISGYGAAAAAATTAAACWPTLAFQQPANFAMHYPYGQRVWCKQEQDTSDHHNNHNFSDLHHQLQLTNTHNFFQQNSVLHNLMGMDHHSSSTIEHSSGSNSVMYGGDNNGNNYGNGTNSTGGYVIPMATVIASDHGTNNGGFGDSSATTTHDLYGTSTDAYHRSLYYLSQQSQVGVVKASAYDQGSACNNWVPTAVPTLAPRSNFTVWNDA